MSVVPPLTDRLVRVAIVDDDKMIHSLLEQLLLAGGFDVVGHAYDGDQVPELISAHRPDVVLMDLRMERVDGIAATRALRSRPNPPGVIALTSFDSQASILDAVDAGAGGFLAKDAGPAEIFAAIRSVANGDAMLSPRATRVVMDQCALSQGDQRSRAAAAILATLTERERDVVALVVSGRSNQEIADELFIGQATVKTHVKGAMEKFGVTNRVSLAVAVSHAQAL